MAETQVLGWGTQNAPSSRTTKDSERFVLLAVDATFDGTGAAGDFVPAVQVLSDAGEEVGTFPLQSTVTAGSSATVTFAPFLRGAQSSTALAHTIGFYNVAVRDPSPAPVARADLGVAPSTLLKFTFAGVGGGTDLLDVTVVGSPTGPSVVVAGMYVLKLTVGLDTAALGPFGAGEVGEVSIFTQLEPAPEFFWSQQATQTIPVDGLFRSATVEITHFFDPAGLVGPPTFEGYVKWPNSADLVVTGDLSVQRLY